MAQTSDGYLWLGTPSGLIRFDGLRFVEWKPPAASSVLPSPLVSRVLASRDGALWIATASGIARLEHGRIRRYPAADRMACRLITAIAESINGGLWMLGDCPDSNRISLLSLDGSVQTFGAAEGLPAGKLNSFVVARDGSLRIGMPGAICTWTPRQPAACLREVGIDGSSMIEGLSGEVLITDSSRRQPLRALRSTIEPLAPRAGDLSFVRGAVARDRDGGLWAGTAGAGVVRIHDGGIDRYARNDGLTANVVTAVLEDREGDLWVSTTRGLDRFRDPGVVLLTSRDGLSSDDTAAVHRANAGGVWVGTGAAGGLNLVEGKQVRTYRAETGLPPSSILAIYEDPSQLWVATAAGLAYRSAPAKTGALHFNEIRTPAGERLARVFNIVGGSGRVLVADAKLGLFTALGPKLEPLPLPGLQGNDVYRTLIAHDGAIWVGHFRGGVCRILNGSVQQFTPAEGLADGPVRALYEDASGAVWVGGGTGLSRYRNNRWTTWTKEQGLPDGEIYGIIDDVRDGLWLMTPTAVLRTSMSALEGGEKSLTYVSYGLSEGLRLKRNGSSTNPLITRASDGRIWLVTEDGVAVIDPDRVHPNPVPPPLNIEQALVDGRPLDLTAGRAAAFRGRELQIAYTGVSLMAAQRVHFKYRMAGLERDWTDAGTRRNVTYANLAPGHYRFELMASNNDGVWSPQPAQLLLEVTPYFYQTAWFAVACALALALSLWGAHRLKVRRMMERFQLIAAERTRFTRELHDSLLQGFSGVVMQLEAAARQFETAPERSRDRLHTALDQADESLKEARQMILSMRIPALENSTLPDALQTVTRQAVEGLPLQLEWKVAGRVRQGQYDFEANTFLMVREAVSNAIAHASPAHIRVEMNYTGKSISVTIKDDGAGCDPEAALAKPGHWGLRGMQERIRQMGGIFTFESAPGKGTRLHLELPWKH